MRCDDPRGSPGGRRLGLGFLRRRLESFSGRIRRSPLAYRLARGAVWSTIGAAISRVLALLASIFVARVLVKEAYGALGVIQGTVGFFAGFAGFGLGIAATKYVSEHRKTDPARAGRIVGFAYTVTYATGASMSLALFLSSDFLARRVLAAPALGPELRIGALLVFLGALNGLQMGILSGFEAFRAIASVNLRVGLASAPIQMMGAWLAGLRGSVWALVVTAILNVAVAQSALRRTMAGEGVKVVFAGCTREARLVGGFGSSLVITGLVVACANWIGNALVVNQESGYAEMAALNAANNWFGIVVFFAATIQQGIFPALSESVGLGDRRTTLKIIRSSLFLALIAATPLAFVGIVASAWIMGLYGHGLAAAWPVLALTVFCAWVYCFHVFLNQFLLALGRPKWYFLTHVIWASTFVGLGYAQLRPGAEGLALSRGLSYLVLVLLTGFVLWRLLRSQSAYAPPTRVARRQPRG
jgi:O-antigen/teichoic acid export membrane protein